MTFGSFTNRYFVIFFIIIAQLTNEITFEYDMLVTEIRSLDFALYPFQSTLTA